MFTHTVVLPANDFTDRVREAIIIEGYYLQCRQAWLRLSSDPEFMTSDNGALILAEVAKEGRAAGAMMNVKWHNLLNGLPDLG